MPESRARAAQERAYWGPQGSRQAAGGQDELGAPGRRLAGHLGEAEVPAYGERHPQAARLHDGQVRSRRKGAVFWRGLDEVALPVRGEDPAGTDEVGAVEDVCDGARDPLREPVGDEDAELSGEPGEEPGARTQLRVLGVPVDGGETRVPAGEELGEDNIPQRGIPPAQPPNSPAGEPEVGRHLARLRA
jgi:hypothetical protein